MDCKFATFIVVHFIHWFRKSASNNTSSMASSMPAWDKSKAFAISSSGVVSKRAFAVSSMGGLNCVSLGRVISGRITVSSGSERMASMILSFLVLPLASTRTRMPGRPLPQLFPNWSGYLLDLLASSAATKSFNCSRFSNIIPTSPSNSEQIISRSASNLPQSISSSGLRNTFLISVGRVMRSLRWPSRPSITDRKTLYSDLRSGAFFFSLWLAFHLST